MNNYVVVYADIFDCHLKMEKISANNERAAIIKYLQDYTQNYKCIANDIEKYEDIIEYYLNCDTLIGVIKI